MTKNMVNELFLEYCKRELNDSLRKLDFLDGDYMAIVSRVVGNSYSVLCVLSRAGVFKEGDTFDLNETYCKEVVETRRTVVRIKQDEANGFRGHPLYERVPLDAYIASPLLLEDEVWGTVNFSSMHLRRGAFTEEEVLHIEALADRISKNAVLLELDLQRS